MKSEKRQNLYDLIVSTRVVRRSGSWISWFFRLSLKIVVFPLYLFIGFSLVVSVLPELGERFASALPEDLRVYLGETVRDEVLADYSLNRQRSEALTAFAKTAGLEESIKFYVLDGGEYNAFASGGGYVYVFSGLLDDMESPEMLAGLLTHEIAHVELDHSFKSIGRAIGHLPWIIFDLDEQSDPNEGLLAELMAHDSRVHEFQADAIAIKELKRLNIDPSGVRDLLLTLEEHDPYALVSSTDSHPSIAASIEAVDAELSALGVKQIVSPSLTIDAAFREVIQ